MDIKLPSLEELERVRLLIQNETSLVNDALIPIQMHTEALARASRRGEQEADGSSDAAGRTQSHGHGYPCRFSLSGRTWGAS